MVKLCRSAAAFFLFWVCVLFYAPAEAASAQTTAPALYINEVCADNESVWTLGFSDYLEVYNAGKTPWNLADCRLEANGRLSYLPDVTVDAGDYAVLVCDGKQVKTKLPKEGGRLALLTSDRAVIDAVELPPLPGGVWLRETGASTLHSPGFPNTVQGEAAFHESVRGPLTVNEVVSANFRAADTKIRYADVIEIMNAGEAPVLLSDCCLSDDQNNLEQYTFPRVCLAPGECFVVSCTEKKGERSAGFKIASEGETIYLTCRREGKTVFSDAMNVPHLPMDVSYGRKNGELLYFSVPTVGKPNADGYERVAAAPALSASSGYYAEPFQVTIEGEGPFFYTVGQEEPTLSDNRYTGPITIDQSTTLRVIAAPEGAAPSETVTAVYRFDRSEYALPCAFITVPDDYMKNRGDGLLLHAQDRSIRVPANLTYLGKGITPDFSIGCGLGISGQTSRTRPKKNFKVVFRSKFGEESLNSPVFSDADISCFGSLLFRVGTTGNPIRDILGVAIGKDVMKDVLFQHYQPVNLFIGGQYHGVYYMREHIDAQFIVNHLGGDTDHVDMVHFIDETEIGSNKDWVKLLDYCRENDLKEKEHYDYVASEINLDSFIDYFIWRPYTGDTDHPNIRYARSRNGKDTRWHIVIYDMDWAFTNPAVGFEKYVLRRYDEEKHNNIIIHGLLQNDDFRARYMERLVFHMNHTFDTARVLSILNSLNETLAQDLPKDRLRWNSTMASWNRAVHDIKTYITTPQKDRRTFLVKELQRGLRLSDAEVQTYFGSFFQE